MSIVSVGPVTSCTVFMMVMICPRFRIDTKAKLTLDQIRPGEERLQKIVRKLIGLIKRNSTRDYEKGENPAQ
jgi:hypothetical protein